MQGLDKEWGASSIRDMMVCFETKWMAHFGTAWFRNSSRLDEWQMHSRRH